MEHTITNCQYNLRRLLEEDFSFVNDLYSNPKIMTYIIEPLHDQAIKKMFNKMLAEMTAKRSLYYVIESQDGLKKAGLISALWYPEDRSIVTGTIIDNKFQNKGLSVWAQFAVMDRAKKHFPINKCTVFVDKENEAANASCRRIGFKHIKNNSTSIKNKNSNQWEYEL